MNPEIFRQVYKYLLVEDFLIYKLTGVPVSEYSVVSSTLLFNIRKEKWWDEMLEFLGIGIDQLPELMSSNEAVGYVTGEASKETGLSVKTLVSTSAFYHAAGAIGTSNIVPSMLTEMTGMALLF